MGGMAKKIQGNLTRKQSIVAVTVAFFTVVGIIQFGVF